MMQDRFGHYSKQSRRQSLIPEQQITLSIWIFTRTQIPCRMDLPTTKSSAANRGIHPAYDVIIFGSVFQQAIQMVLQIRSGPGSDFQPARINPFHLKGYRSKYTEHSQTTNHSVEQVG